MAARHKNQHAQLSVTTTLRGDDVAELARQAAAGVKSSIPGQPFIRYEGTEDDTLVFSIRHLGGHVGLMSFAVKIEAGASGETSAHTRIQAFKTVQSTYLFIPVSPKRLVGYREYRRFAEALSAAIVARDPAAACLYTERPGLAAAAPAAKVSAAAQSSPAGASSTAPLSTPARGTPSNRDAVAATGPSRTGPSRPVGPTIMFSLGVLLFAGIAIKGLTGYFQSQAPVLIAGLAVAVVLMYGARRWGERPSTRPARTRTVQASALSEPASTSQAPASKVPVHQASSAAPADAGVPTGRAPDSRVAGESGAGLHAPDGRAAADRPPAGRYCHECGAHTTTRFCPNCGTAQVGGLGVGAGGDTGATARTTAALETAAASSAGDTGPTEAPHLPTAVTAGPTAAAAATVGSSPTMPPAGIPVVGPTPVIVTGTVMAPANSAETDDGPKRAGSGVSSPSHSGPGGRLAVLVIATLVAVAGLGVGGKFAWDATAVRRDCALQPDDVQSVVDWPVATTQVTYGPSNLPFVRCDFTAAFTTDHAVQHVSVTTRSTIAGATPQDTAGCVSGGYWGGPSSICLSGNRPNQLLGSPEAVILASGTRLAGNETFDVTAGCAGPPDALGYPEAADRQRCFDQMTTLMSALAARLGVPVNNSVSADQPDLDKAVAAAAAAGKDVASPPAAAGVEPTPTPDLGTASEPQASAAEPPLIGNPDTPVADSVSFEHFDVSVNGGTPADGTSDAVQVTATVCVTSLTADALNGSVRVSWDPWSAQTTDGRTLKPITLNGAIDPFPHESRAEPGQCVTGTLVFEAPTLETITYANGQGDAHTFAP